MCPDDESAAEVFLTVLMAAGSSGQTNAIPFCPRIAMMKPTQTLHEMGQSLWLDNITRGLLTSGTLSRYMRDFSVT